MRQNYQWIRSNYRQMRLNFSFSEDYCSFHTSNTIRSNFTKFSKKLIDHLWIFLLHTNFQTLAGAGCSCHCSVFTWQCWELIAAEQGWRFVLVEDLEPESRVSVKLVVRHVRTTNLSLQQVWAWTRWTKCLLPKHSRGILATGPLAARHAVCFISFMSPTRPRAGQATVPQRRVRPRADWFHPLRDMSRWRKKIFIFLLFYYFIFLLYLYADRT
jgi:hypothetical protein